MTRKKKEKQEAHTFNCTGLQVCLKVTLHTYAQAQDSQCIGSPMTELSISS